MSTSKHLDLSSIADAQKHTPHQQNKKNLTTLPPSITFPFTWNFGTIVALSKAEQQKLNAPRGRKHQCKPCAICGSNGGCLTHRKVSDGNPGLICESCAIDYVQSAMKISHVHGFKKEM